LDNLVREELSSLGWKEIIELTTSQEQEKGRLQQELLLPLLVVELPKPFPRLSFHSGYKG